uniref:Ribosomal protein L5 n=1 Tax=Heterostelium pallidum TaxID=13642 RepID=Q5ILK6_HETPA|nr:ribosomal protein L5 [Heterostelium pallidum]AAU00604.1 ribosomal protein L5 [Heterostelium pallidum]
MNYLKGYNNRILSKLYLNKVGQAQTRLNSVSLKEGKLELKVKKYSKELFDLYELISILEQNFMQKPQIKFNEVIERATNIKIRDLYINMNLYKENSENFFWFFILFILSDRRKRNLIEINNIDLNMAKVNIVIKDLKIFRKILWNNVSNIENQLQLNFFFKTSNSILSKYRLYFLLRYLLKIKKKKEYAKK